MIKLHVIRPEELTPDQIRLWTQMMSSDEFTDSPFFHPEYIRTLGRFREPVRVAIVTENGHEIAFFPFEQHGKTGRPLGIKLCDFQGIVRAKGTQIDARELLQGCGLSCWNFDHVVAAQPEFSNWHLRVEQSPYINLTNGFEAYVDRLKQADRKIISRTRKLRRRAERGTGPIRTEWNSTGRAVLETLLAWKSAQRARTGTFDVLQFEWVTNTLDALRKIQTDEFGGVLFALYFNDILVAASLCLRTRTVLHKWFSAYDANYSNYSPGSILSMAIIEEAAARGIQRIDLGRGDDAHKHSWCLDSIAVGEGAVDTNPMRFIARKAWQGLSTRIKNSPLRETARIPKRIIKKFIQKKEMKPS